MSGCEKNVINVTQGYWRKNNQTDIVTECSSYPDNCLGGNANFTCVTGNIGALCEACDLYGEMYIFL